MTSKLNEGSTVCLVGAPADGGSGVTASLIGLYTIIEHLHVEPSAYVWEAGALVAPADDLYTTDVWFISEEVLFAQADPKGYALYLAAERHQENMMELHYERCEAERQEATTCGS